MKVMKGDLMIDQRLHTPEGVKDYLPNEEAFKIEIERRIETIFTRYGYVPLSSPTFEYMEVFEGMGSVKPKQMYKFLDRDSSMLALRSDMTPAIARIAATAYDKNDLPLRFYYIEDVFRYNEKYQGKLREFTQAGIELIGVNSADADAEVIAAAVNSLIASGLKNFKVCVGNVLFFNAVIEEGGFDNDTYLKIQDFITEKDFAEAYKLVKESQAPKGVKSIFEHLPVFIGGREIISKAKEFIKSKAAVDALISLENVFDILKAYGLEKFVKIDLSIIGNFDYYTGITFRGYAEGTGLSVISGGRYDKLIKNYGADFPSVGFAIKLNNLISALENQKTDVTFVHADTLIAFTDEGRNTAVETADELRSKGLNIENSLLGADIQKNMNYAEKKKMGGILYFSDNENVKIIDMTSREIKDVKISELLKNNV